MPSAKVWLFQRSGLSQQKQNTLEGSSKKRFVDALYHGRQTGEEYSSVILSKIWNLNKPLRREAVVFTIQTAGHSLRRNATVGGRYHSYKITWRRRTFIQRQSQSTVMAQEKIAAEPMNVEHPTGKTTSEILMRKQSIQSRSIWSKG